ncbi:tetratricopeptide repeat protein [Planctomycetota bacterium]
MVPRSQSKLSWRKKLAFGLVTTLIFFVALELLLAALGFKPGREIRDPFVGFQSGVPLFTRQGDEYVTNQAKLSFFNPQRFPCQKRPEAYRVFCLGGSTTNGRPFDHRTAYPSWLAEYLRARHPDREWQVINCGGISYASYRLAVLLEELRQYQPDLIILYTGHNEFLEDRTYGDVRDQSQAFTHVVGLASYWRTYGLMERVIARPKSEPEPHDVLSSEVDTILEHGNGPQTYHRDDQGRQRVLEHFRFSLRRMAVMSRAAGARVILVQPASNLRDFGPFKSENFGLTAQRQEEWQSLFERGRNELAAGRPAEALALLLAAERLDRRHAELLFLIGLARLESGVVGEARDYYVRARDEDVCPLRAVSEIHQIVRDVAAEFDLPVVDYPKILQQRCRRTNGHDIPGTESFLDHVHPKIEAHGELARALYETMNEVGIVGPFSESGELDGQVSRNVLSKLKPYDYGMALHNLAMTLSWTGKNEEAIQLSDAAVQALPDHSEVLSLNGRLLEKLGRHGDALARQLQAVRRNPKDSLALSRLADCYGENGDYARARDHLLRAIEHTPPRAPIGFQTDLHLQLGRCYSLLGDAEAARREFRRALEIDPNCDVARQRLDALLEPPAANAHP